MNELIIWGPVIGMVCAAVAFHIGMRRGTKIACDEYDAMLERRRAFND